VFRAGARIGVIGGKGKEDTGTGCLYSYRKYVL
jgi:hypothetical protein